MSLVQIVDYPHQPVVSSLCLHELLTRQAALTPEVVAVVEGTDSLTYGALEERANQLAHVLRALYVGPETVVGLAIQQGLDQIQALVALFGILKAGGAVLTLSGYYPPAQLRWMMEDAQVGLIVAVQGRESRRMEEISNKHIQAVCLDDLAIQHQMAKQPTTPPSSGVTAHHLAYVIYTSGSTGNPKGVLCEHDYLGPLGKTQGERYQIKVGTRIGHAFSWQFDGIWSVIATAIPNGATLCLPEKDDLSEGESTVAWIERHAINLMFCTPNYLASWPDIHLPEHPAIVAAGESCREEVAKRYEAKGRFYTAYGPAEAGICLTTGLYSGQGSPTMGQPLPYVRLVLLDQEGNPVHLGEEGEVVVRYPHARGYTNPRLTEQRFLPGPEGIEYHTGDYAKQLPDGSLLFAGRKDTQIKLPGGLLFNTEQLEQLLGAHEQVQTCVVLWRANRWLVAYVKLKHRRQYPIRHFCSYLNALLPEEIARWCLCVELLDKVPLTPNGKIDRTEDRWPLPTVDDVAAYSEVFQAPTTAVEVRLAQLVIKQLEKTDPPFPLTPPMINVLKTPHQLNLDSKLSGGFKVAVRVRWRKVLTAAQLKEWSLSQIAVYLQEQPMGLPALPQANLAGKRGQ